MRGSSWSDSPINGSLEGDWTWYFFHSAMVYIKLTCISDYICWMAKIVMIALSCATLTLRPSYIPKQDLHLFINIQYWTVYALHLAYSHNRVIKESSNAPLLRYLLSNISNLSMNYKCSFCMLSSRTNVQQELQNVWEEPSWLNRAQMADKRCWETPSSKETLLKKYFIYKGFISTFTSKMSPSKSLLSI